MSSTRYFLYLRYLGTQYFGWQSQPNAISIQEVIEEKLSMLLRVPISVVGCGRTDAGVHAYHYVLHFDAVSLSNIDLIYKLNSLLPPDIVVIKYASVKPDAHARFDATSRSYYYNIHTIKSPFGRGESYYYGWEAALDLQKFDRLNTLIKSTKDFESFCKTNSGNAHFLCDIKEVNWHSLGNGQYQFRITSNRFLRGMIRLLVGMYLNVHRGKLTFDQVKHAVENKSRLNPNWSVPGEGLFLDDIQYPSSIFLDR